MISFITSVAPPKMDWTGIPPAGTSIHLVYCAQLFLPTNRQQCLWFNSPVTPADLQDACNLARTSWTSSSGPAA